MDLTTCLIVDDSRIIRKVARRIVEPDVLLIDWNMPVMDGLSFLRRLRGLPGGDRPKVLFCTIETRPDRIAEALAAGADDYVMKPFDGEILQSKLAEVGAIAA
ncbi:MAG: two-component system response regulator [Brevundimonas sp.]|uniref:response regulator n=1 Tax=Brevundimonas sp. TaxID=1871086 RepID=UPI000DBBFEF5|nr:response regulator [Brevundimonas sp.]PZU56428.1 MAG: two-component system response regulator [Brevundimonas sp.]